MSTPTSSRLGHERASKNERSRRTSIWGLWFVAAEYADRVEALDSVLAGMGCTLYSHPVYDTSTWRTNTAGFVEQDLLGEFRI